MSADSPEAGTIAPSGLPEFLAKAYDPAIVRGLLSPRFASGVSISRILPQRAHLTKDGRLMIAYRVQLFHARRGLLEILVFLHNTSQSRLPAAKTYRIAEVDFRGERDHPIRRHYIKAGITSFLSVFPLDPELRVPMRLLKPAQLLACYNKDLRVHAADAASSVNIELLGYRPERRAILKVRALAPQSDHTVVVKLYRRQEAERVWLMCSALSSRMSRVHGVTLPVSHSPEYGALCYPFRDGETLHNLLEQKWATGEDLERAGRLLRQFHGAVSPLDLDQQALRTFTFTQEWEILDRWRRFLKHSGSPGAGFVAKYVRVLAPDQLDAPATDALVHRDFYPKQLLVHPWTRHQSLIDLDTTAFGPAALDVGNFLAHLHLQSAPAPALEDWRKAFLSGYGSIGESDAALFELTAVVRMFCLAVVSPPVPGLPERLRAKARELEAKLK